MAEGSNGTAVGAAPAGTAPLRLRRPKTYSRLVTPQGVTTSGKPYSLMPGTIIPPPDYDLDWKRESLDTTTLQYTSPMRLLEILANLSPEMSKGLWDYMRLLNPGWEFEVVNPGSEAPNARGKKLVEEILARLKEKHGSIDVVLGRMHIGAYMRGAYFAEAVFDVSGREMVDIATPDPASVRFKAQKDPVTGREYYQLGQWQNLQFVPLDQEEGVSYIPVDPFPGSPYGRPLVSPAMFSALFLLGLLHDLRRVISQQGWPRIHIKVLTEKLLEGLQQTEEVTTPEDIEAKLQAAVNMVKDEYSKLQPDDAYITGDEVEIAGPIGAVSPTNLSGVEGVIEVVERMLVRALKSMPLMLGITDGVSEANANRQWEITVAGVKAMQHLAESMLERFLELACRQQGIQADVRWVFSEIRASEAQRDALTRSQEIDNELKLRDAGIIDQEEAAMNLVGHPPAEEEAPGQVDPEETDDEDDPEVDVQDPDENPEPGSANTVPSWDRPPGRLVEVEHPLRPPRIATRRAYRAEMQREGWTYAGALYAPVEGADEPPASLGYPVERWVEAGRIERGDLVAATVYDLFVRLGGDDGGVGARAVRAAAGGSALERRPEHRRRDGSGRRARPGTVGSRHGRFVRRVTGRRA